ncbi:MAG: hypothetical protein H8E26_13355 [FCB group bacterium]|nr:hypothetical protein [FCB group bacterium]MBL7028781.1 hypothetical protein [Candidatus Neomarinimicrobiota bacterium]MBL7121335.1 hypothetical protein [Candidatus Neomarinimicrobiota bacterium]
MIYILYSNDYEVFLGGNYLPENDVLISTTENILKSCEEIGVPMTFFCDLTCLWRYRELGYTEFPDAVEQQLVQTIRSGHDVQTHIHPHWLDTEISYGKNGSTSYKVDPSKFLMGNWSPEDGTSLRDFCVGIYTKAKQHLEDLLIPIDSNYECMAYRAGGYGVQPNSGDIYSALQNSGYKIDSSIVPGMTYETEVNRIDFTKVPSLGNYSIDPDKGLTRASDTGVFEIPVLALRKGEARWPLAKAFFRKVIKSFLSREKRKRLGYPIQMSHAPAKDNTLTQQLLAEFKIIRDGWYMLELGEDADLMMDVATRYIDQYKNDNTDLYVSISCHSKSMNPRILKAFKKFHRQLDSLYGSHLKAITFKEAEQFLKQEMKVS